MFRWEGKGVDEVGKEKHTGIVRVRVNSRYFRPSEVVWICLQFFIVITYHIWHLLTHALFSKDFLLGDASKAKEKLGWQPRTSFLDLVKEMVDADIELMRKNPQA